MLAALLLSKWVAKIGLGVKGLKNEEIVRIRSRFVLVHVKLYLGTCL